MGWNSALPGLEYRPRHAPGLEYRPLCWNWAGGWNTAHGICARHMGYLFIGLLDYTMLSQRSGSRNTCTPAAMDVRRLAEITAAAAANVACNGAGPPDQSRAGRAARLRRMAAHGAAGAPAIGNLALVRARTWALRHTQASRAEAQRVRWAPVKALHAAAQETQKTVLNREVASTHDQRVLEGAVQQTRTWKGTGSGSWKQRTGHEACRITFSSPAMTMLDIARSLRPKASHGHCAAVMQTGIFSPILSEVILPCRVHLGLHANNNNMQEQGQPRDKRISSSSNSSIQSLPAPTHTLHQSPGGIHRRER